MAGGKAATKPKKSGKKHKAPKGAIPVVRSEAAREAARKAAERKAEADALEAATSAAKAHAAQLAQMVNLRIAGYSFPQIALALGCTEDEIERRFTTETARFVRTQPALRTFVRDWISHKYTELLDAVYDEATDKAHPLKLENQDRALRILKEMGNLHGAAAPAQTEVKIETAPEGVERLVAALASAQGMGYDPTVFDVVPGSVVHEAVASSAHALEVSRNGVEEGDDGVL